MRITMEDINTSNKLMCIVCGKIRGDHTGGEMAEHDYSSKFDDVFHGNNLFYGNKKEQAERISMLKKEM